MGISYRAHVISYYNTIYIFVYTRALEFSSHNDSPSINLLYMMKTASVQRAWREEHSDGRVRAKTLVRVSFLSCGYRVLSLSLALPETYLEELRLQEPVYRVRRFLRKSLSRIVIYYRIFHFAQMCDLPPSQSESSSDL